MYHWRFFWGMAALAASGWALAGPAPSTAHTRHTSRVARPVDIRAVRLWAEPTTTRVVLDLSGSVQHSLSVLHNPERVVLDVTGARLTDPSRMPPPAAGAVKQVRMARRPPGDMRFVFELARPIRAQSLLAIPSNRYGYRLIIDMVGGTRGPTVASAASVVGAPSPVTAAGVAAATGSASVVAPEMPVRVEHARAEARDLIVAVDAGHGGEDPGAIGKSGTREKDVVLAIAKALYARINAEPGLKAILTRDGDYFVPLRDRMRRARAQSADLFVSIHADSVRDRHVDGSSVYILSQRGATDEASRWLAERENASDLIGGVSLDDKGDVLASVLLDLSQSASLSASQTAAEHVLHTLNQVGEVRKPSVQQARFMVLKSPDIPSMLVETAYISNPREEQRLRGSAQQGKLAAAIYQGVRSYFYADPPAGTRIAQLAAGSAPRTVLATSGAGR